MELNFFGDVEFSNGHLLAVVTQLTPTTLALLDEIHGSSSGLRYKMRKLMLNELNEVVSL